ncbi:MAG TPA: alpha-L-fucosidase [Candidatus Paceibacterota bacterium]|nr:alpha-L-fucosidase [Verrucomicrobiota bacterium]HRY47004.1 alpha-L-fucosidase [Candidatus Paceibacterota bacterium]HRZ99096.1 alpha-L-fucosidase [Candidatus Paceibacterota bacterium]
MKTIIGQISAIVCLSAWALSSADVQSKDYTQETTAERDARMAWFREARFGMFIHWGVYSVPAGEWKTNRNYGEWFLEETKMPVSEYEKYAAQFNPVKFDARAWARMAKEAGMKYMVITSKHHDGFGLFRSQLTDWCIKSTPFQRDPLKELAEACKAEGIVFCFYHSIMDWHHPDWGTRRAWHDQAPSTPPNMDRYVEFMKGQLKELITGYGPLGILWFDGEWESPWTHERGVDLYNYVRGLQPNIIVNNRVGKGRSGMQGMDQGKGVGDYGTPEQEIPPTGFGPGVDWESCMTMNNHWGYNKHDQNWKPTQTLLRNLIDCASKGGNYLLNIGPTSEGLFPEASVQRLTEMGAWMKVNSEAIYGTTASPFKKLTWGKATQKPGKLYLHVFDWPESGSLVVPIANPLNRAYLLAARNQTLPSKKTDDGLVLQLPRTMPDANATVVVLEITGAPDVLATSTHIKPNADGAIVLKAADAELVGSHIRLESKANGPSNIGFWTDVSDYVQWPVLIAKAGAYDVEAEFACDDSSAGSECALVVGTEEFITTVPSTGGWNEFRTEQPGTIQITISGATTIAVKAKSKPGSGVVNLRQVILRPAQ